MARDRYDVFLSHASADKPAVLELARRLQARGLTPWVDAWNLIPGAPWQEALEEALAASAACAVCMGPGGSGPWQNVEMRAALSRQQESGMRVIPVLLPGAERGERSRLPSFLRENTWVELRQGLDDEGALHRLVCGIRGIEPGPEAAVTGLSPYRGFDFFRVEDAPFFFGREALVGWLIDKLRPSRATSRLLALVGPSGSGKSSLARAGVLAALKSGEVIAGSETWPVAICRPGERPLEDLALALGGTAADLLGRLQSLAATPRMLHLTVRLALQGAPPERRFVLLVDPLEPLFSLDVAEVERRAFLANLLEAAAAADGPTVVILTLRSDFLGAAAAYPDLAAALSDHQILVGPMSQDELRRAIERPALLAGGELEGGVVELLLRDVEHQAGSLPLLEHVLAELWERREGRRVTLAAYTALGGLAGAFDRHAGDVFDLNRQPAPVAAFFEGREHDPGPTRVGGEPIRIDTDPQPRSAGEKPREVFISYAWGDDTPEGKIRTQVVEGLYSALERAGFHPMRDRDQIRPGERISAFIRCLTRADLVVAVISDKYLRSPYCMYEIYRLWQKCQGDADDLVRCVVPIVLPEVKVVDFLERAPYLEYWSDRAAKLEALIRNPKLRPSSRSWEECRLVQDFAHHVDDILVFLQEVLMPRKLEAHLDDGFQAVRAALRRRMEMVR